MPNNNIWWGDDTPSLVDHTLYDLITWIMAYERSKDDETKENIRSSLLDSIADASIALAALRNHYDISYDELMSRVYSKIQ